MAFLNLRTIVAVAVGIGIGAALMWHRQPVDAAEPCCEKPAEGGTCC